MNITAKTIPNVMQKTLLVILIATLLTSCMMRDSEKMPVPVDKIKFAAFNVSFAHDGDPTEHFERWVAYMNIPVTRQDELISRWKRKQLNEEEKALAERIIQIRNIAAIIQQVRPDVLLLNEFNNDGVGEDYRALLGFQNNYLNVSQSLNSVNGGDYLLPIEYEFMQSYATNTGLQSNMDLGKFGDVSPRPENGHGFGFYHGHYAFALLSRFEIDVNNTRTFQTFKRSDLSGAVNPTINDCSGEKVLPDNMACGDTWHTEEEWSKIRLSSKNHVDAPIKVSTSSGVKVIHALLSHPTPPAFDYVSDNNKYRNSDENRFWLHYINDDQNLYDDQGKTGGLKGDSFVLLGDLNADPFWGRTTDPRFNGIQQLLNDEKVNQSVASINGEHLPVSEGARQEPNRRQHPYPEVRTATFGTRADYAVPSADLKVVDAGVYWVKEGEAGRLLFNDPRIGERGTDKDISSDHRLVWVTIEL